MHASESLKPYKQASSLLFQLLLCAITLVWLNHPSINAYYTQKYHDESPLAFLDSFPLWAKGELITQAFSRARLAFFSEPEALVTAPTTLPQNTRPSSTVADPRAHANVSSTPPEKRAALPKIDASVQLATLSPEGRIMLTAKDEVFFVGDSLMQGVAPFAMIALHKRYGIKAIDLSKQSTGLSYAALFDWPKVIEETLAQNPTIRVIAVMLGPNDPWDIAVEKGKPYARFKSERWREIYSARVATVLQLAKQYKVRLIWIEAPAMRDKKLSEGMKYLNEIYKSETQAHGQIYMHANDVLGYPDHTYSEYVILDNKKTKMRSGDGIHFTPTAQRRLAEKLLSFLEAPLIQKETASQ